MVSYPWRVSKPPKPRGVLRAARGVLLAVSSAGLAITAHALANGSRPDTGLTLVLALLVGWIGAALAERTRRFPGVLAVLGASQLAMHVVLTGLMGHLEPSGAMILAHAGATVVTAILLRHAESMLLAAATSLRFLLPVVWRPATVPAGPVPVPVRGQDDPPLISVLIRRIQGKRGPPGDS